MKIVLATGNLGKVRELSEVLRDLQVEVLSLKDFPDLGEIIEDGHTFEENAIIKAKTVATATNLIALADDSGLEVDFLKGAPGIYSARFAGEQRSDSQNNLKVLELLDGVPDEQRTARFRCVIAVCAPGGETVTADGTCEGVIINELRGEKGFGYDPLFFLPEYNQTMAQLELSTKNKISHRGKAYLKVKSVLRQILDRVEG